MRATVSGADGFVGQWLVRRLLELEIDVTGMIRTAKPNLTTLDATHAKDVQWRSCEMSDLEGMRELMRGSKPDAVFHLAAQSFVPASLQHPVDTFETNVLGTVRLLEATRASAPQATVVVIGSSDAYGRVTKELLPLREDAPLRPRNPYAASKAAVECVALQYAHAGWCRTVVTRSFNHIGPGQSPAFAVASFAKQIAEIKNKRQPPSLRVGLLTPRRDFSDVRDVANAYVLLAQRGRVGRVYNVCSGRDHSIKEIVESLLRIGGVEAEIREDPALVRAVETPQLVGDPSLIHKDTGWSASTPLEQTLRDLFHYYADVAA